MFFAILLYRFLPRYGIIQPCKFNRECYSSMWFYFTKSSKINHEIYIKTNFENANNEWVSVHPFELELGPIKFDFLLLKCNVCCIDIWRLFFFAEKLHYNILVLFKIKRKRLHWLFNF